VLEIEETKTGQETAASATTQVTDARNTLADIHSGTTDVRIMERPTRNRVGRDLTEGFDLSRGRGIGAEIRGPEGRTGFGRSLEVTRENLTAIGRQLLTEGLPPGEPGPTRLVETSAASRREQQEPGGPTEEGKR
jgi:hypothetical protein